MKIINWQPSQYANPNTNTYQVWFICWRKWLIFCQSLSTSYIDPCGVAYERNGERVPVANIKFMMHFSIIYELFVHHNNLCLYNPGIMWFYVTESAIRIQLIWWSIHIHVFSSETVLNILYMFSMLSQTLFTHPHTHVCTLFLHASVMLHFILTDNEIYFQLLQIITYCY